LEFNMASFQFPNDHQKKARFALPAEPKGEWILETSGVQALAAQNCSGAVQAVAQAMREGDGAVALILLKACPGFAVAMVEASSGETLLHVACAEGLDECARELLTRGANPSARAGKPQPAKLWGSSRRGASPLMLAARADSARCVHALIKALFQKNALNRAFDDQDVWGRNATLVAASLGHDNALKALLDTCPQSAKALDHARNNAAMLACSKGSLACLAALLPGKPGYALLNGPLNSDGCSELALAVIAQSQPCVDFLVVHAHAAASRIKQGNERQIFEADTPGMHPLALAAGVGNARVFASVASATMRSFSSIKQARQLMDACEAEIAQGSPMAPKIRALRKIIGSWEIEKSYGDSANVKLFISAFKAGLEGKPTDRMGYAVGRDNFEKALATAIEKRPDDVRRALSHGALWRCAVQANDPQAIALFRAALATIPDAAFHTGATRPGEDGVAPLALAARLGRHECCAELLGAGALRETQDFSGVTPFMEALKRDDVALAATLDYDGARDALTFEDETVLDVAILAEADAALAWLGEPSAPASVEGQDDDAGLRRLAAKARAKAAQMGAAPRAGKLPASGSRGSQFS
jgi:ankyrin repeat protein